MNESEIRDILVSQLAQSPAGQGAAFIQELFLEQFSRRADLVMANGKLSVFEIKSPLDNLERLKGQVETYLKYFERVTIVCALKHQDSVISRVPSEVGVWVISDEGKLKVIQKALTLKIENKETWLSFLPVSELRQFLREHQMRCSGSREQLVELCCARSMPAIRAYALKSLKNRTERIKLTNKKKMALTKNKADFLLNSQNKANEIIKKYSSTSSIKAIPRTIPHSKSSLSSSDVSNRAERSICRER